MVKKEAQNGTASGFDADADFIPFDLSDDSDSHSGYLALNPNEESNAAWQPTVPVSNAPSEQTRKGKRSVLESSLSPQLEPSTQRPRVEGQLPLNPWQSFVGAYAHNEPARMYCYFLPAVILTCRLHLEILEFLSWI